MEMAEMYRSGWNARKTAEFKRMYSAGDPIEALLQIVERVAEAEKTSINMLLARLIVANEEMTSDMISEERGTIVECNDCDFDAKGNIRDGRISGR